MKFYILILFLFFSCLDTPNSSLKVNSSSKKIEQNTTTTRLIDDEIPTTTTTLDDNGHGDGSNPGGPTDSAPIVFEVSDSNIELNLNEEVMIPFKVKALDEFSGGDVTLEIENSFDDIEVSLNVDQFSLEPNESQDVILKVTTIDMSPSFKDEKIKLLLKAGEGEKSETRFEFNFTVEATLIIGVTSDAVPHTYNLKTKSVCLRAHGGDGARIIYKNMTMNFGENGNGPCMHAEPPTLDHCRVAERLAPGEEFIQKRVPESAGKVDSLFYNHFENSDNIGRRIYFNLDPGEQQGKCDE